MSEIEKMYENAGVEKTKGDCLFCPLDVHTCVRRYDECPYYYPPFNAGKQIELIKWLMKYDEIHGDYNDDEYGFSTFNYSGKYKKDFEESLASVINNELWQSLTEEEKQQVKGILE